MNEIVFSVVIVSYKNLKIVIDCLDSIDKYNDIGNKLEVIVVDNSPNSIIFDYVQKNYPKVKIIKNDNKGFGQGNNVGAKISKGKYLLLLNPDTILIEPIFSYAIDKFEKKQDMAMFGLKLIDINLKENMSFYFIDKYGIIINQVIKLCNRIGIYIDGSMFTSGANIFIKKDVFIKCGMFDENIFMYYEESDLVKRVKLLNMRTAYFKSKRIIHLESKTTNNNEIALKMRLKSLCYYCNKYGIDYAKWINTEIRYDFLKSLLYKHINNNQYRACRKKIRICKESIAIVDAPNT